ncbi:IniB N-terminal domain-containing protein [Microbacterium sp.]|uniref:IniB N-terminal domain-containing protein n=1 Tax=Microbacterium sp. TaxID=51671 RepID=UPI00260BB9E6|nr:IniB N-terminal domain-containing protein [Microbacterium sp.]
MSTPVATIADALIAFILSLLHDPEAAEEFEADPGPAMHGAGLQGACVADVRAVAPVVVDHPSVTPKPPSPDPDPTPPDPVDPVVREIVNLVNQFTTVDARSTIVDQSVNQNIWTEGGDVTQLFDQEAVVASGDESVAAGDDASIVNSDTDITTGDVSIGNDEYNDSFNQDNSDTTTVDDSFQDNSTGDASTNAVVDDSFQDNSTDVDVVVDDSNVADSTVEAAPAPEPAPAPASAAVEEPADVLESDMTATADDSYESDAAGTVMDEPMIEEPVEEP